MKPPVIIVGAGRSGTNALRDALCSVHGYHTWPCDEINYIWRVGNRNFPTDELLPIHARPEVVQKITAAFARRDEIKPGQRVVEKTCANSLRVAFVAEIFPTAQFIHLVRDGRAVVASATKRWTAPLDIPYLARKARFVPRLDLPFYAVNYLKSRASRRTAEDDRLSWWGPRIEGMSSFSQATPLVEVAAHQWVRCVTAATDQLAALPAAQVHTLSYRQLVSEPQALQRVFSFLGEDLASTAIDSAAASLHGGSLDSWRTSLTQEQQAIVSEIVHETNSVLGLGAE